MSRAEMLALPWGALSQHRISERAAMREARSRGRWESIERSGVDRQRVHRPGVKDYLSLVVDPADIPRAEKATFWDLVDGGEDLRVTEFGLGWSEEQAEIGQRNKLAEAVEAGRLPFYRRMPLVRLNLARGLWAVDPKYNGGVFGIWRRGGVYRPPGHENTQMIPVVQMTKNFGGVLMWAPQLHRPGYAATPERVRAWCRPEGNYGTPVFVRGDRPFPAKPCPECFPGQV